MALYRRLYQWIYTETVFYTHAKCMRGFGLQWSPKKCMRGFGLRSHVCVSVEHSFRVNPLNTYYHAAPQRSEPDRPIRPRSFYPQEVLPRTVVWSRNAQSAVEASNMRIPCKVCARASCGCSFTEITQPGIRWSPEPAGSLRECHICRTQFP